ncbi:chitinase-3-like protein 1 [Uranotaenia lowii]|uniref:chitinase-3-like protein 1 n=1 Tax=Uranotaenia lowii TaxID=190385 RepID=UPI00247AE4EA|nr:chitinase-3-like protein 1 [Uranotaenia lowii]
MRAAVLIGFVLSTLMVIGVLSNDKKFVCYYGSWAVYRNGKGAFSVDNIDPFLCTHLIYSFVGLNVNGTIRVLDPWNDLEENWGRGAMKQFNNLKRYNPKLRTLVAIGGWNEGSMVYSGVAKNSALRSRLARDAADFCLTHGFDGFDLDWEYPGQRDGDPSVDRENFSLLLAEMREEFDKKGLLLTAAVASTQTSASISYNIPEVAKFVDFINVMAYDLHGPWEPLTGHNAPLLPGPHDISPLQYELNVEAVVRFWLQSGAPAEKLVLGLPLYGRSFTLRFDNNHTIGAATSGPGQGGQYSYEAGFLGYNEVCEKLMFSKWNRCWDDDQKVPYAYSGNQWVGYDDEESLTLKVDLIKQYGLAGAMVWSIETDDFHGSCGEKNVLLNTIARELELVPPPPTPSTTTEGSTQTTTTTPDSTTTTSSTATPTTTVESTQTATTTTPGSTSSTTIDPQQCPGIGYFRDAHDCSKFYYCDGTTRFEFRCAIGLYFDETILACNWAHLVDCKPLTD